MQRRRGRPPADDQKIRNCLNAMCTDSCGKILNRRTTGWYGFTDPLVRSYVRLVAESEGADLGEYNFVL
jgi:hypothetical protein